MRKLSLNWFRSLSYSPPDANRPEGATAKNNNADYTRMRHYSTIPEDRRSETAKKNSEMHVRSLGVKDVRNALIHYFILAKAKNMTIPNPFLKELF
ncbi:hypothetical protein CEXT_92481 [Caerostris extrusa]|uniref:Uncharacterized protein n=1 Tax=Caerostris extrusa TaxID=172846 RepID=A0AAV4RJ17_CAEEX|nr:hypothetical protein CEXT_92481 [Caerostris extrusa]